MKRMGLTRHLAHRQRYAALRVTVGLGQHHTGQWQSLVKRLSCIDGILAGHAVDDEQGLPRGSGSMHGFHLGHHLVVDVQPTSGVDNQYVGMRPPGLVECSINDA